MYTAVGELGTEPTTCWQLAVVTLGATRRPDGGACGTPVGASWQPDATLLSAARRGRALLVADDGNVASACVSFGV